MVEGVQTRKQKKAQIYKKESKKFEATMNELTNWAVQRANEKNHMKLSIHQKNKVDPYNFEVKLRKVVELTRANGKGSNPDAVVTNVKTGQVIVFDAKYWKDTVEKREVDKLREDCN